MEEGKAPARRTARQSLCSVRREQCFQAHCFGLDLWRPVTIVNGTLKAKCEQKSDRGSQILLVFGGGRLPLPLAGVSDAANVAAHLAAESGVRVLISAGKSARRDWTERLAACGVQGGQVTVGSLPSAPGIFRRVPALFSHWAFFRKVLRGWRKEQTVGAVRRLCASGDVRLCIYSGAVGSRGPVAVSVPSVPAVWSVGLPDEWLKEEPAGTGFAFPGNWEAALSVYEHRLAENSATAAFLAAQGHGVAGVLPPHLITGTVPQAKWRAANRPLRLAVCGADLDRQAISWLFEAVACAHTCARVEASVYGAEEKAPWRKLAARFGCSDRVSYHGGEVPPDDCDVALIPDFRKGHARLAVWALAAGLPVIGPDLPSMRDYLGPACGVPVTSTVPASFVADLTAILIRYGTEVRLLDSLREGTRLRAAELLFADRIRTLTDLARQLCRQ